MTNATMSHSTSSIRSRAIRATAALAAATALVFTTVATAAGYSLATIWEGRVCGRVSLNDHDDVAWGAYSADFSSCEIRFYDAPENTISVISQDYRDYSPQLANSGDIVWHPWDPVLGRYTVMYYDAATSDTLEFDDGVMFGIYASVNGQGDVVVLRRLGPYPADSEIRVREVSTGTWSTIATGQFHAYPLINDRGDVAWLGSSPDGTVPYRYDPGTGVIAYVPGAGRAFHLDMNARGDLAWEDEPNGDVFYFEAGSRKITACSVKEQPVSPIAQPVPRPESGLQAQVLVAAGLLRVNIHEYGAEAPALGLPLEGCAQVVGRHEPVRTVDQGGIHELRDFVVRERLIVEEVGPLR